ncbi:Por secretion system C-terminal sorting domain-containing protein [Muriicola jejuensis]|uniref:T9SS type A sorting domain-containing protein n=1 Tax=Muriicola jejuensis TaxID=504488 RepID=A0A6P0U8Q4_9FLAO|nr:zinc-dependent metalloprotease family protein [Muriicola jejuensis]NER09641.1 T9SS type A sorting domain-containing protein [Muriicola jejuensis]SMP07169.1 Por secretion system C-terminal sorting domain-containing protein [Muriicola jejuensis]
MTTKLRLVLPITMLFACFYAAGQTGYWQPAEVKNELLPPDIERLNDQQLRFYSLENENLNRELTRITSKTTDKTQVFFPSPEGRLEAYTVEETPVFDPGLTARYPQIRSFTGTAVNDPNKRVRFSVSQNGIEAMFVISGEERKWFMQRVTRQSEEYVLYNRKGDSGEADKFVCATEDKRMESARESTAKLVDDQRLRKYRIAVSATGEYTQYHGGTVADALAAINATLTRVNEVFITDLGITLELVADNDLVIYTNPETDPYQANLNSEVQTTLNNLIGDLNYDVGHLFHEDTNGGNAGFIGSVCRTNQKGSAYSAALNPQGDLFDLDYVSHELGHQFGANHTWSFDSEGTGVQAEPASGSTIMGYAGIVQGENVQSNGDDYFHYYSIFQISAYVLTTSCAVETAIANSPPVITPSEDYVIPKGTAFVLSGVASDPDPSDVLTYTWEQIDNGVVTTSTFGPQNASGANFRSLPPTTSPKRYFPRLSRVVQGQLTQTNPPINSAWESVSNVQREMNFALTVRDNAAEGGQVASDVLNIRVSNAAGPFTVLSQSASETYSAGTVQTVTWDVANTNSPPINAQFVEILLSLDGGLTFPIVLSDKAENDGSHEVLLPGDATSTARIMVKGLQNVFFALNSTNFTIEESPFVLQLEDLAFDVCQPADEVIPFVYQTYGGFNEEVTFSAVGLPGGLGASFLPGTATANGTPVDLTISNTSSVAEGQYPIQIRATAPSFTQEVTVLLNVFDTEFPEVTLLSPANSSSGIPLRPILSWDTPAINNTYDVQIASDPSFTNIVQSARIIDKSYTAEALLPETTYYWRVKPVTNCGEGVYGSAFSFTTLPVNCKFKSAQGLPVSISSTGTPTVQARILVVDDLPVADINVSLNIDHTFLSDLIISLISPAGTEVILTSNSCGQLENVNAVFDDDAPPFVCGGNPAISGTVKPLGSLASFNGESSFGEWILLVRDTAPADGGLIQDFTLELCVEGVFRPDADGDNVFDDGDDLCLGTPPNTEVNANGCPVYRFEQNNFNVQLTSESCISNNDGVIRITANAALDYSLSITGNGINETSAFNNTFELTNLSAGNYTACINGTDGSITYEEFCFDFVISEPDPLSVLISLDPDASRATLSLSGSQFYNVELNGILTQTTGAEYTLNLKTGLNTIKVTGALSCQGVYEEVVLVGRDPVVYPNPFQGELEVFVPPVGERIQVNIYNLLGQLVHSAQYAGGEESIRMELGSLPAGVYLLRVSGEYINYSTKVIKR